MSQPERFPASAWVTPTFDLPRSIFEDYRNSLSGERHPGRSLLSEREKYLLRLVADGFRNKEIAGQLGVTTKSVETYRSRVMKKLGCSNSAELVRYAIREHIAAA